MGVRGAVGLRWVMCTIYPRKHVVGTRWMIHAVYPWGMLWDQGGWYNVGMGWGGSEGCCGTKVGDAYSISQEACCGTKVGNTCSISLGDVVGPRWVIHAVYPWGMLWDQGGWYNVGMGWGGSEGCCGTKVGDAFSISLGDVVGPSWVIHAVYLWGMLWDQGGWYMQYIPGGCCGTKVGDTM